MNQSSNRESQVYKTKHEDFTAMKQNLMLVNPKNHDKK